MPELTRILYVEDEPDIRAVAKIALVKLGKFEVKMCASGAEALDCVVEFAPDLFLLDVMMPGMNGPETLARLRELPELAEVPVIFMTANIQPDEVVELKNLNVVEVIAKPFDAMKLADQLRSCWDAYHNA